VLRRNDRTGEWSLEFCLDEGMDPAAPQGYCGLVATQTLTDRAQHGKPFEVIDVLRELLKLNKDPALLRTLCGDKTHDAIMALQSEVKTLPTALSPMPPAAQFSGHMRRQGRTGAGRPGGREMEKLIYQGM
jgi:hypothetical protein